MPLMIMDPEQKTYELSFLINPLISEENIGGEVAVLREVAEKNGGFVISEEPAKMQRLSYPIKDKNNSKSDNFESAYFGWIKFYLKPAFIENIKKTLDSKENVIRYMITDATKESAIAKASSSSGAKKTAQAPKEEKESIKPEQIDEKLEEMLNK